MASFKEVIVARILVVDDDAGVAMVVGGMLAHLAGHHVTVTTTIDEAMATVVVLPAAPFDLVVVDYDITDSGTCFSLLSRGLDECPDLFPRRVLIMSDTFPSDMDEQLARICGQGFIPFCIQKPFKMHVLEPFVSYLLSLQHAPAAP